MQPQSIRRPMPHDIAAETARFMSKVYAWMTGGLALTGGVAYFVAGTPGLVKLLYGNVWAFYALVAVQLLAVVVLSMAIKKMNALAATLTYLFYAALSGVTFSVIFLVYKQTSIFQAFSVTAFSFAGLSAFGFFTKRDLGPVGSFCAMGLWGLIGYSVMALFFPTWIGTPFDKAMAVVGVIVFAGLTAYDTQKIKAMNVIGNEGTEEDHKEAIMGALILYLDFVNLFLEILKLMGKKRG